jgi:hypothetical protein
MTLSCPRTEKLHSFLQEIDTDFLRPVSGDSILSVHRAVSKPRTL